MLRDIPLELDAETREWRSHWTLDPTVTFLNHGSFGAAPIPVLQQQQVFRQQLEADPVQFFGDALEPLLDRARAELAAFVGANPEQLAFVPNATTGVNTVLRSLPLQPGDEILVTNHEYNACRNAVDAVAQHTGATVVVATVPFPLRVDEATATEQIVAAVMAHVTSRTRIFLIDHITSQTALIMPICALIQQLQQRGIDTLVDGAHAPGMVPLVLEELGAAYYTGNCHKWLCAPKGCAFLWARADRRDRLRPLVISHGANAPRTERSRFHLEFDWTGTHDPTPYLCLPTALCWMASLLPGGWAELMAHNHQRAIAVRQSLCHQFQIMPPCPEALVGAMAVVPLPDRVPPDLQQRLYQQHRIQVPVIPWEHTWLLRLSAQIYNTDADYDQLAAALQPWVLG